MIVVSKRRNVAHHTGKFYSSGYPLGSPQVRFSGTASWEKTSPFYKIGVKFSEFNSCTSVIERRANPKYGNSFNEFCLVGFQSNPRLALFPAFEHFLISVP